jgi:hypothetical protein
MCAVGIYIRVESSPMKSSLPHHAGRLRQGGSCPGLSQFLAAQSHQASMTLVAATDNILHFVHSQNCRETLKSPKA